MIKMAVKLALGIAAIGLAATGGALAGGTSSSMPSSVQDMQANTMSGMISEISQNVTSNIGMLSMPNEQLAGDTPTLDLRQMIEQAISSLPEQQRDQLATEMASQNLSLLGGNSIPSQVRVQVRDQIMMDRFNNISKAAPTIFRSGIQPMMVQSMISQIRPWEFPSRFKSTMMPVVVGKISNQIKMPQLEYMQEGIGSDSFPAVPGVPAGMFDAVSGQIKQQQMQQMRNSVMEDQMIQNIPQQ